MTIATRIKPRVRGKQGKVDRFAAASIATRVKIKVRGKQGKQGKAECLATASILQQPPSQHESKAKVKGKQSKAKQSQRPCCRLNEPINQSIQSSLRVSYPILQPNHLQPMHGRVASPMQVSQSNEKKKKRSCSCSCSCSSAFITGLAS
jgi:hypothetical protein